jgi:alanyl-tRNA synthetase
MMFGEYKALWKKESTVPFGVITGEDLFRLHDTFGLLPDLVADIVSNYELQIDRQGYESEMQKQRERGRASWKAETRDFYSAAHAEHVDFVGYDRTEQRGCKILSINRVTGEGNFNHLGDQLELVLDKTPFYAEAGGQVGDTGWLLDPRDGQKMVRVTDTKRSIGGQHYHCGVALRLDGLGIGEMVTAVVNAERRDATRRNHTATHLLHAALQKTMGTHVKQAGSLVAPERLRFDFTHYTGLGEQALLDIEDLVNQHVLKNDEVVTTVMDLDTAVNTGAMALFGEKYADQVRVLTIDDFSKELCGGTHVRRTGDIGLFKIVHEASVAAGTRRIEALTGTGVLEYLRRQSQSLAQASEALRSKPGELIEAIEKLTESEKKLRKELEAQQMKRAASAAGDLVQQAREIKGVRVIAARVEVTDRAAMRQMIDDLRGKLQSGVIVLGSAAEGRVSLIAAVTKDLTAKLDAGKIVKLAATYVEGSGGGRKDLAEAGGKNPAKLDESIQAVPGIIERML